MSQPSPTVRPAIVADLDSWAELRTLLWPQSPASEHRQEIEQDLSRKDRECLLAFTDERAVGFVELSLRSVVDGCQTSPVAYIEGWFVREEHRGHGVGAALLSAAEDWARRQGCSEIGSDTELGNDDSVKAHKALGYEETGRVVQFRKSL